MQRNTGYFPTESLEPCGNRLFSRSALNEGYLFRGSLNLSDAETLQIIRNRRGEGLLCIGQNRFSVAFRPTKLEYELITTSRKDLERIAAQNHRSSSAES